MQARVIVFPLVAALVVLTAAAAAQAAEISVVKPTNDETIHSNQGKLTVQLRRAGGPPGAGVRLVLDGAVLPKVYRANVIKLEGIDRGSHVLQAVLADAEGKRLAASTPVTFHMWQASRLFPSRK
ncbi:MAG TPA: hypothetical protein VKA16_00795 [Burkholderiales bacterium]|nr:hypothetical protein [Burkholderiales bacterium]